MALINLTSESIVQCDTSMEEGVQRSHSLHHSSSSFDVFKSLLQFPCSYDLTNCTSSDRKKLKEYTKHDLTTKGIPNKGIYNCKQVSFLQDPIHS